MKELNELIDFYEMTGGEPQLLVMLIELRRHRMDNWKQRAEAAENALKLSNEHAEKFEREMYLMMDKAEAAESKLAELEKQEPVLYALRFKNSRGQPEKLINENCLFRDKEKAAAYGLGGNYVTQESGKMEWVPNPALNPEVIPLFTRPVPAINLAELVLDENDNPEGFISWYERHFAMYPYKGSSHVADCENAWRAAILRNIEEQSQ